MQPKTTLDDFRALVRRAELPLTEAQVLELYEGPWAHVERIVEKVRGDGVPRFAEPADIFKPEGQK